MAKRIEFKRATIGAALALVAMAAPAAAMAQDGRYVPAYEPGRMPNQLGAYSLAGAFSMAVVNTADNGLAEVKPVATTEVAASEIAPAPADGSAEAAKADIAPSPSSSPFQPTCAAAPSSLSPVPTAACHMAVAAIAMLSPRQILRP